MTLEEAIEILTQYTKGTDLMFLPDFPKALKLGVEALKRELAKRTQLSGLTIAPLPGETKS